MFFRFLDRFEEYLCAVLFLFMTILGFSNVAVRYLTPYSLSFSEELLVNFFVWISFLGGAIGIKRRAHVGVALLFNRIPRSLRAVVLVVGALGSAVLFILVIKYGWELAMSQYRFRVSTYSMQLPLWVFSLGVPIGGLTLLARLIQATIVELREILQAPPDAGETTSKGAGSRV